MMSAAGKMAAHASDSPDPSKAIDRREPDVLQVSTHISTVIILDEKDRNALLPARGGYPHRATAESCRLRAVTAEM
jgi:hypothetical protein